MEEEEKAPWDTELAPPDWQGRLESLQTKHNEQSLEQQRHHLAQLLQLQDLLLSELATQCSGEEPLDEEVKAEVLLSLGLNRADEGDTQHVNFQSSLPHQKGLRTTGGSTGGHFEHCSPPASPPLHGSPGDTEVDSNTPHSSPPPPASGGPQSDEPRAQPQLASLSPASTEYLELPGPSHTAALSPMEHPPHACDGQETSDLSTPGSAMPQNFITQSSGGVMVAGSSCHDESFSRSALMEKHAKHVEDLQSYYETQLASLQSQLSSLKLRAHRERAMAALSPVRNSSPMRRLSFSPSKGRQVGHLGMQLEQPGGATQLEQLLRENQRLRGKCKGLEQQLEDCHK